MNGPAMLNKVVKKLQQTDVDLLLRKGLADPTDDSGGGGGDFDDWTPDRDAPGGSNAPEKYTLKAYITPLGRAEIRQMKIASGGSFEAGAYVLSIAKGTVDTAGNVYGEKFGAGISDRSLFLLMPGDDVEFVESGQKKAFRISDTGDHSTHGEFYSYNIVLGSRKVEP